MKYQSELVKELVDKRGHEKSSLHYQSECINQWIEETKGAYPKLTDYQSEWINYIYHNTGTGGGTTPDEPDEPDEPDVPDEPIIGEFPYETFTGTSGVVENVVPLAYKSATLKGSTKYRDVGTGEFLETFEDGRNLELVSVKAPVLTTSNEDGTKTNILTVNEEVTLRGIGDVKDELNLLTGELTQRIGEVVLDGSEDWIQDSSTQKTTISAYVSQLIKTNQTNSTNIICERFPSKNVNTKDEEGIYIHRSKGFRLRISIDKLSSADINGFKTYLQSNPVTVQYLATESIKTVTLTVVDENNQSTKLKPFEGTMHIQTTSNTIEPIAELEIPVEAITQNLASFIE